MAKCDVCGKTTLLPEKFGIVNVCKICFIKANGPFWKHQYDRHEDAEKHRCDALEAAQKRNFPQPVVSAINDYFMQQMNSMLVCDCCSMPVQHRQQLGDANICNACYGKINTSAWKTTKYEDSEEVENNRQKILKIANKYSFPPIVIDGINSHFTAHLGSMQICDCCGMLVRHRQALGKANICNKCYGKINTSEWKATEYEDNEEVENNREKILKVSTKHNFPAIVVEGINAHFDSKLQKGLLYSIDGDKGQKLKVFADHCVLITDDDDFDIDEVSVAYAKALKRNQPKENLITNSTAKTLARSVLTGGIVKAGISLATTAAINAAADKYAPSKASFKLTKGSFKIDYHIYTNAERQKVGDGEIGFIRFVNSRSNGRQNDDVLFFFDEDTSKLDKAYKEICKGIDESARPVIQEPIAPQAPAQPVSTTTVSSADELLKFKQLLDMGAITQEEYDAKKKQILGL